MIGKKKTKKIRREPLPKNYSKRKSNGKKRRNVKKIAAVSLDEKTTTSRSGAAKKKYPKRLERKKSKKKQQSPVIKVGKEVIITLFIFSFLVVLTQAFVFSLPKVEGYSMMPTVMDKERFFVNKLGTIRRFSLVYYRDPETGTTGIRRVIGLPGEQLSYRDDQLIINDQEVVERFLEEEKARAKTNGTVFTEDFTLFEAIGKDTLSEEEYFVLGDNRSYASDSRTFGFIKKKNIIGVVELRWLPFHRLTRF